MRSSQKNAYGKLKPLNATERINFRANTDIAKMISAIADTADHASVSDLIRTAVTIAYLCWCEYRGNLLLRNHDGRELQLSFPERDIPDGKLGHIIQVRFDVVFSSHLHTLAASGFASTPTEVIRRSLSLYRLLLQRRDDGWDCIYVDEAGHFTLVPILTLIRPHSRSPHPRKDPNRP